MAFYKTMRGCLQCGETFGDVLQAVEWSVVIFNSRTEELCVVAITTKFCSVACADAFEDNIALQEGISKELKETIEKGEPIV